MAPDRAISRSIQAAILQPEHPRRGFLTRLISYVFAFFTLFQLRLGRIRNDLFQKLRNDAWYIDEDGYEQSFAGDDYLKTIGDMGYSGSSFFNTSDGKYLVKSVPRRFEHSFFRDDLLQPYVEFMTNHPKSLLIRITDFLGWRQYNLGGLFKVVPNYHIVMENLLIGQSEGEASGGEKSQKWDLKPIDYFFPGRDIAQGKLTSEATKSKLADKFDDKITITRSDADEFLRLLGQDTGLLSRSGAVDYSLFLVRIPLSTPQDPFADEDNAPPPPTFPPFAPPGPPTWRTGIKSSDGKYVYRATILDFFWAKHKTHAKLMTALIKWWNLVDKKGPMSITTTPDEYRERFVSMCKSFLEVQD